MTQYCAPGYIAEEKESCNLKTYAHPSFFSSIYNSQNMEAT